MFSRRERLPRVQFEEVMKRGRRLSSKHFLLILSEKAQGYAVVIPKKVIRHSSARHRLKRQVLEALRTLPLPSAAIVFPRTISGSVDYQDIVKELAELLKNRA